MKVVLDSEMAMSIIKRFLESNISKMLVISFILLTAKRGD
jgi:hypothetical protein